MRRLYNALSLALLLFISCSKQPAKMASTLEEIATEIVGNWDQKTIAFTGFSEFTLNSSHTYLVNITTAELASGIVTATGLLTTNSALLTYELQVTEQEGQFAATEIVGGITSPPVQQLTLVGDTLTFLKVYGNGTNALESFEKLP